MSGPVTSPDAGPIGDDDGSPADGAFEITPSRRSDVAGIPVRRALPQRRRRTIGTWCFVDHFGPVTGRAPMRIGPHPHTGLQTVTWLVDGEVLHHDSLGSEQLIRPGQLNLMTAGRGVAHAEESPGDGTRMLHGAQLWVALPDATRHGPPAFEHHATLPSVELAPCTATVLVGELAGARSPARHDTPLLGAALAMRPGGVALPIEAGFEHGIVVLDGALEVDGQVVEPGLLAHLGAGRDELRLQAAGPVHALLLGGAPFAETPLMWWNFVARTRDEIEAAWADWEDGADRFGPVASALARIDAPRPPWTGPAPRSGQR